MKKARTDSGEAAVAVASKRNEKLQLVQAAKFTTLY
jgi:hypothetical protein